MNDGMTETDWSVLERLENGTLTWGAHVGVCWPFLARRGYVQPNFGSITDEGRAALRERAAKEASE